jgi:hypothetical protein
VELAAAQKHMTQVSSNTQKKQMPNMIISLSALCPHGTFLRCNQDGQVGAEPLRYHVSSHRKGGCDAAWHVIIQFAGKAGQLGWLTAKAAPKTLRYVLSESEILMSGRRR